MEENELTLVLESQDLELHRNAARIKELEAQIERVKALQRWLLADNTLSRDATGQFVYWDDLQVALA